jgi:hypothetical protein
VYPDLHAMATTACACTAQPGEGALRALWHTPCSRRGRREGAARRVTARGIDNASIAAAGRHAARLSHGANRPCAGYRPSAGPRRWVGALRLTPLPRAPPAGSPPTAQQALHTHASHTPERAAAPARGPNAGRGRRQASPRGPARYQHTPLGGGQGENARGNSSNHTPQGRSAPGRGPNGHAAEPRAAGAEERARPRRRGRNCVRMPATRGRRAAGLRCEHSSARAGRRAPGSRRAGAKLGRPHRRLTCGRRAAWSRV